MRMISKPLKVFKPTPIKRRRRLYSDTVYGQACRYGHRCIVRHCNRYGKRLIWEDMRDAIQEGIADYLEEKGDIPKVQDMELPDKLHLACATVNAYKRIRRESCFYHPESYLLSLDTTEEEAAYIRMPTHRDPGISSVERDIYMEQELGPAHVEIASLLIAGYSQVEIAQKLGIVQSTVSKAKKRVAIALQELRME